MKSSLKNTPSSLLRGVALATVIAALVAASVAGSLALGALLRGATR